MSASRPSLAAWYSPHFSGLGRVGAPAGHFSWIQAAHTVTSDSAVPSCSRGRKDMLHLGCHKLVNKMFTTVCKERLVGWMGHCGRGSLCWTLDPWPLQAAAAAGGDWRFWGTSCSLRDTLLQRSVLGLNYSTSSELSLPAAHGSPLNLC